MSETFLLPGQAPCPKCGATIDAAGVAAGADTGAPPEPGDFTVCVECLAVLRFAPNQTYHRVTIPEIDALDPALRQTIAEGIVFAMGFRAFRRQRSN